MSPSFKTARPCPQLADRQRGGRLKRRHEATKAIGFEPAPAAANELQGHRGDAGGAGQLLRGNLREPPIVGGGEVVVDGTSSRGDEMEVVEQPLGRGWDPFAAPHVVAHQRVDVGEHASVFVECRRYLLLRRGFVVRGCIDQLIDARVLRGLRPQV